MKKKIRYVCQNCGVISPTWSGKCFDCGNWNSFLEEFEDNKSKGNADISIKHIEAQHISDITFDVTERISSNLKEFDTVLGGGIVDSSLVLVGGDPGIGKSTLLLQTAINFSKHSKVLYVSGEESLSQIKMRANRLSNSEELKNSKLFLLSENEMKQITKNIEKYEPKLLIIDSIQTLYNDELNGAAGSLTQIRDITHQLMLISKKMNITTFIIGHVTKSGSIAGPKVLEHMVDTVLYFEGDQNSIYKILRAVKNRFGSTNELGIFEMKNNGLNSVINPSKIFIDNKPKNTSGSVISVTLEGTRPILLEVQALTGISSYSMPKRLSMGIDYNKLNIIIAVMEKITQIDLSGVDVYINLVSGINVNEPSIDLAIAVAIYSIHNNIAVSDDLVIIGEIGLTGEIRGVTNANLRVSEAIKLGYKNIIIPKSNITDDLKKMDVNLIGISKLSEVYNYI